MSNAVFDFLVVGAQKCATTTVHEWLSKNKDIFVPDQKELPFFTSDNSNRDETKLFFQKYGIPLNTSKLSGKVTPQYMTSPMVASRIFKHNKNIKIIIILRDPVERACSHYKMNLRKSGETLTINERIRLILDSDIDLCEESENMQILNWGKYGMIIDNYLQCISKQNILVIDFLQIQNEPHKSYKKIAHFLGINDDVPSNINTVFHRGGTQKKLPDINKLKKSKIAVYLVRKFLKDSFRRSIIKKYNFWNIKPDNKDYYSEIDKENIKILKDLYTNDFILINDIIKKHKIKSLYKYIK